MQAEFTSHRGPFTGMTIGRLPNQPPLEFFDLLAEWNVRTQREAGVSLRALSLNVLRVRRTNRQWTGF